MTTTNANAAAQRHPAIELLARYRAVLQAAWQARHELAGPKRLADEAAFLPAALAIQETPVHPAPRRALWAIMAFFSLVLAWSWWGQVDIVAVADGRVVVSERTKIVQPLEAAVVRAIHVKDGDKVRAGQVLIELDPTSAQADSRSVQEQRKAAQAEATRARSLMTALQSGQTPTDASSLAQAEWADIRSQLARLDAEQARRQAELATVSEQIAKLQATLPLARQREADFKALAEQGFMSGHAGQDRVRERIEQERDLATQQARLREAEAVLAEGRHARAAFLAETQRSLADRLAKATLELAQLDQQGAKTAQRELLTQLSAPVAGTVQQLAIHTAGGVVTPAQALLVIVPDEAEVIAEVTVDNKDIGFVHAGQPVAIKLETFNFTKYGTVPGKVKSVSADAVPDEQRGAVFKAQIVLDKGSVGVDGKALRIAPGMNLTAEIKTGQRRVIEFLLSPIQRQVNESLRER